MDAFDEKKNRSQNSRASVPLRYCATKTNKIESGTKSIERRFFQLSKWYEINREAFLSTVVIDNNKICPSPSSERQNTSTCQQQLVLVSRVT